MSKAIIYHNPRCSKSRAALELVTTVADDVEVIRYLEDPPGVEELKAIARRLGLAPLGLVRTNDAAFKDLGLSIEDERSDDEWLALIADNPRLLERPVVVVGDRARIGRPPENVLSLFESPDDR